jgi:glycosyltransferase involved in cell wall biosynthesis
MIYGDGTASGATRVVAGVHSVDAYPSWKRPATLRTFWSALKQSSANLLYARLPDDFLWMASALTRVRPDAQFIYAIANDSHCNPWRTYEYKPWFHNPLYALALRTASVVAVQHPGQAQLVRRFTKGRLAFVPNMLREQSATVRDYTQTTIDIIWVAQIRPVKQLHIFLDVAEKMPGMRFAVVGGFDPTLPEAERQKLEHRIKSLKQVSFYGPVNQTDIRALLTKSKVLVNTSGNEGFPNTMLEAWGVGVPIVSLRVDPGGIIERQGLGIVSGTVDKMKPDIEKLINDQFYNISMGNRGLAYTREKHSPAAVLQALESFIPGIIIDRTREEVQEKHYVEL